MFMGQDSLQSSLADELCESPQPPELEQDQDVVFSSDITTERQRELAAKVSCHYLLDTEFQL